MMTREEMIRRCIQMTAELEGIDDSKVDRLLFEVMSAEKLVEEYNWLYDMVFLK
jgi:hypothetical protein